MPSNTWVGTQALKESRSIQKLNRDIIEYSEVWKGKHDGTGWPAYTINGTVTPTVGGVGGVALRWYDISVENPVRGAVASYTARASNKFDIDKAEWVVDVEFVPYLFNTGSGYANYFLTNPVARRTLYSLTAPVVDSGGTLESPPIPVGIVIPSRPPPPTGWTYVGGEPTWRWMRNGDSVSIQAQVYSKTTTWTLIRFT
jgi:hypothetical protein